MKHFHVFLLFAAVILTGVLAFAAEGKVTNALTPRHILQHYGFIDEDGDGINDLARDHDHDGIPNCIDPDWSRPQDGTGYMNRHGYQHQHDNQFNGQSGNNCNNYNFNYTHNYQWQNSGANGTVPGANDPTNPDPNQNKGRKRRP